MAKIRGTDKATRQADEEEWMPGLGWTTVEVYEGPKDDIRTEAQSKALTGRYSRIRVFSPDNVVYRVHATIGGLDGGNIPEVVNQWEVLGQGIQEAGFSHPSSRLISSANLQKIKQALQDAGKIEETSAPLYFQSDGSQTLAASLWLLLKNEATTYQDSQMVLRHTLTANSYAAIAYSFANINRRHTRAQLPSDITPEIATAIDAIPTPTQASGFQWSWLKQAPHLIQALNARPQVVTEWVLYGWSTYYYEAAT